MIKGKVILTAHTMAQLIDRFGIDHVNTSRDTVPPVKRLFNEAVNNERVRYSLIESQIKLRR
jgi:H2-forming N5,N10-methylenetetrahydromethanopterin dehydrogenase-like enzyme